MYLWRTLWWSKFLETLGGVFFKAINDEACIKILTDNLGIWAIQVLAKEKFLNIWLHHLEAHHLYIVPLVQSAFENTLVPQIAYLVLLFGVFGSKIHTDKSQFECPSGNGVYLTCSWVYTCQCIMLFMLASMCQQAHIVSIRTICVLKMSDPPFQYLCCVVGEEKLALIALHDLNSTIEWKKL